jgi:hypothetical protein
MRIGIRLLRTLFERLDMLDESDAPDDQGDLR